MDEIAPNLSEEVVMQIGSTNYTPINTKWYPYLNSKEITKYYISSSIIISHGGAGTILDILSIGKPLIIVPRLKRYNEIIDDQQIELAEYLSKNGRATCIYDVNDLAITIHSILDSHRNINQYENDNQKNQLARYLKLLLFNEE